MPTVTDRPEQMQAGMEAWDAWAERCGDALVDMGSPLGERHELTAGGGAPAGPGSATGYSILSAGSIDEAAGLLEDHPHLHSPGGPSIELLEAMSMPGM